MKIYNLKNININNKFIKKDILAIIIAFLIVAIFSSLFIVLYSYKFYSYLKVLTIIVNSFFIVILFVNILDISKLKRSNKRIALLAINDNSLTYTAKILEISDYLTLAKEVKGRKIKCEIEGNIRYFNLEDIYQSSFDFNDTYKLIVSNDYITEFEVFSHE